MDIATILLAKENNSEAINKVISEFKYLAKIQANQMFIIGAEKDDVYQEGMIGLLKAIKYFDPSKNVAFKSFATLCIQRQLITAIKKGYSQASKENIDLDLISNISDNENLEESLLSKDYFISLDSFLKGNLSVFEQEIYLYLLQGYDYKEIAEKLDKDPKAIDNGIQRIRKKGEIWFRKIETFSDFI